MLQGICGCIGRGSENILAIRIQHADVDMQAVAGLFGERLGHEAGLHTLLLGHGLDGALQHDGVVAGQQCVVAVLEVDLELARRVFSHGGIGRNALRAAGGGHAIGEAAVIV